MVKRHCCCPNEHCFDLYLQCPECDENGTPHKARRGLKHNVDGTFTDSRDGQQFKRKTTKRGTRLVPQFKGPTDWKSAQGFAAVCLLLSCLGAEGEYVLWDETACAPMTEKEWRKRKFGTKSKAPVRHRVCKEVVTSTCVNSLQGGRGIGCSCNSSHANHWRHRRAEVVAIGEKKGFEVLTTQEEWVDECDGQAYCPKCKCLECKEVVTSTCLNSLQQGHCIGCSCRNKTERKLLEWLQNKFAQARVTRQHPGPTLPGQTHFDFLLTFPDGLGVLIELDGPQHFWTDERFYTGEGCERDLAKERWALGKGMSVVRVLQKDVWEDRLGWDGHILRSVGDSRGPRIFTHDAPEYTSTGSVYVQMRPNRERWMHVFASDVL